MEWRGCDGPGEAEMGVGVSQAGPVIGRIPSSSADGGGQKGRSLETGEFPGRICSHPRTSTLSRFPEPVFLSTNQRQRPGGRGGGTSTLGIGGTERRGECREW
jgi:hypothetical protein